MDALLLDTVRTFAQREIAPRVTEADRADGHLTIEMMQSITKAASSIGLMGLLLPERYDGGGLSNADNAAIMEELGAVDAGVSGALSLTMTVTQLILAAGTEEQKQRWLPEVATSADFHLAGGLNEPDVAGSELFSPVPDPTLGLRTRAVRDGEEYVLTGQKAGWVTNAGIAKVYLVFARTDTSVPAAQGTSIFWVPADSPGLSVGARSELLGLRSSFHAELLLDGVRVPEENRIGPEGEGLLLMQTTTAGMAVGLAAVFVGLARAALDLALSHASTRMSWGVPIRQHQAVALMLADAAVDLRTARLLVREAAAAVDAAMAGTPDLAELPVLVPAAKARAVEVAIANAERCVKILGGAGVTRGSGAEKLLRDAWTGWSCDFTGDLLRLGIANALP